MAQPSLELTRYGDFLHHSRAALTTRPRRLSDIFYYLMLDFYVKTGISFFLRDKRLLEITEVKIMRVNCIQFLLQGPFDGILSFSQGAALASLLCGLREQDHGKNGHRCLQFGPLILLKSLNKNLR